MEKIEIQTETQMDTHAVIGILKDKYKLPSKVAEAIVYAVQKAHDQGYRSLVTKTDLANFRSEMNGNMANFRSEVNGNMANFRSDIEKSIANLKVELIRWIIGNSVGVLLLMLAIIKLT